MERRLVKEPSGPQRGASRYVMHLCSTSLGRLQTGYTNRGSQKGSEAELFEDY